MWCQYVTGPEKRDHFGILDFIEIETLSVEVRQLEKNNF